MSTRNALKANWNFINCKIIAFDWCITMLVKSWEWNRPVPVSAAHSRSSQTRSETKLFRSAFARDDQFGNGVKYRIKWIFLSRWICLSALEWSVFLTLVCLLRWIEGGVHKLEEKHTLWHIFLFVAVD